jgi:hypothetical protein
LAVVLAGVTPVPFSASSAVMALSMRSR